MDFKDILTKFDKATEKESLVKKEPKKESKKPRPSNMLTESDSVTKEFKLPSLKNVFEELSIAPASGQPAQEIQKDGQTIGTVTNPTVANQLKTAMDAGELTIGEQEIQEAEDWIDGAVKKPGAFKAQAERAGKSTAAFAKHVLANKDKFNAKTEKRANLAKTFSKMKETDTPPESSMDLTSPISGGGMRESDGSGSYGGQSPLSYDTQRSSKMKVKEAIKLPEITPQMGDNGSNTQSVISGKKVKEGANMAAQYGPDDGSHNSSNDEKGNAAANAALAANDADTPQLVKEKTKDYDVKPTNNPKAAKGKVLNPKGKTDGKASPETYVESKSRNLPSISRLKSMCNEGLSTSAIQQLHPKCNKKELNIMIKNTKTNLKEGAHHILKAAKHMGHAHGLCKGGYSCPHDEGSEGARAYHEGYKEGLDEACGMGMRNEPIAGMEEGVTGAVAGGVLGAKAGGIPGALAGAYLGHKTQQAGNADTNENEGEVVDSMASYGAMGEAESSPDGNVGADDDGAYDKYDWDAQTVEREVSEDEFEEGNAFSGALAKAHTGDKFEVGGKEFTKTTESDDAYLEEDEWTFESLEQELNFHLIEGKDGMPTKAHITKMCKDGKSKAEICKMHPNCDQGKLKTMIDHCKKEMKSKLDEGYTMSITQGEENTPDRVSVNATDAEADKLIKFVKDVGLGQYGDAEVTDVDAEVVDKSFYGSPEVEVEPQGSHDDMLKLMGIVDMGNGDFEDEVEAPGTMNDVDVQVIDDEQEGMCEACGGDHSIEEGCGDKSMEETQGYNDREDEQLGMKNGKESGKDDDYAGRRDQQRGDFGHRHGGHLEEESEAEADDHAEEAGKYYDSEKVKDEDEYDTEQDRKEHDHSLEENLAKLDEIVKEYSDDNDVKPQADDMHEESDVERDDHAEKAGREVAHDADYDDRRHPGKDGKDVTKDIEYDEMHEEQGYNDREDEQLGMKDGKESGKKQSMKDRRDDSRGDFGHRHGGHLEEESDAEMDDHAERAGKEVAHDAHYDGRDHSGKDGKDVTKDLEYDDYKDHHRADEGQGYDDKEDESLGMRTGKESDHKQSDKARRDDSYGKFGKRDSEHREKSLEEMMGMIDEMSQGYDDKEDESLGMRTGKESGKHQSMKDRRDDSYGKFGKRDEEHRDIKEYEDDHDVKPQADDMHEDQGYDDKEDESLGMRTGKESDKKQSMKDRRDDSYGKFGKRDKEDRHVSLEETIRTLDLLAEVGAEASEEPTQPLSQHDDERLLTKEGAEDAPKDDVNDTENEEITETQTEDQREFAVAEDDDLEEGKIPAGLKAYQDKKKGKKGDSEKDVDEACGDSEDMKEEKLDEWANDAGKNGTNTTFEQDIDFMTKVISGGLNRQKSTGQTTIPVIAGQNDRTGYNGADLVKEGSIMSHDGLAGLMLKMDELNK